MASICSPPVTSQNHTTNTANTANPATFPKSKHLCEDALVGIGVQDIIEQHLEVSGGNGLKLVNAAHTTVLSLDGVLLECTNGRIHTGAVHGVTDGSSVGEVGKAHTSIDVRMENRHGIGGDVILELAGHKCSDLHKLIGRVVGEIDVVTDTRHHTGNVGEEPVHSVLVTGNGDDEVILVVLHNVEENFDGLLTVITVVGGIVEVVRLINKENAAHGLLDHLLGLGSGVADVLSNEIVTSGKDDVSATGVTHLGKDLSHPHSDGSLTSTRSTSEGHVERGNGRLEAELTAHLVQNKKSSNLLHTLLDRDETDEVTVQLVQLILDTLLEHELVDGAGRGGVGHVVHVGDLLEAFLALHLGGPLAVLGLLLDLSPVDVGLVELVAKASIVGTGILLLGIFGILDGLSIAKGVLIGVILEESGGLRDCGMLQDFAEGEGGSD